MSLTTATRALTRGQRNAAHTILAYYQHDPRLDAPPIQRLGQAFYDMLDMLDMSEAELSAEIGVDVGVIERMDEEWSQSEQPGFEDVLRIAHFFGLGAVYIIQFLGYPESWS